MGTLRPTTLLLLAALVNTLPADQIELSNGDTISGKVVSLNATHLKLQSELLGDVTLARENIAAVYFGDKRPAPRVAVAPDNAAAAAPIPPAADDFIGKLLGQKQPEKKRPAAGGPALSGATPQQLVEKLKAGELDAGSLAEVQKAFPLLATKEAGGYFNATLGGLITGKLGVQDIRKDAIKARDGILELKKEIGGDADALNPYLGILEKFIQETEPEAEEKPIIGGNK